MRGARARELDRVLHRLHQRDRIGSELGFAARALEHLGQVGWRGRGVERDAPALPAQFVDEPLESVRLVDLRLPGKTLAGRRRQLSAVDKNDRTSLERQIGVAQRQRRI